MHRESHRSERIGWLRAAVLGASVRSSNQGKEGDDA
jgi:hypothetical protein